MYLMPQQYCRKSEPPEQGARTLQTTDRRQTDGRQHSLKTITSLIIISSPLLLQLLLMALLLPEGDVFCVHPFGRLQRYVELRCVRMTTLVSHSNNASAIMRHDEVLVYVSTHRQHRRLQIITFRVSRRPREMYCGHARLCVCLCVCLSAAACPHYCTDPNVNWRSGRGCPLVVHYRADLQSVHGLRCYAYLQHNANAKRQRVHACTRSMPSLFQLLTKWLTRSNLANDKSTTQFVFVLLRFSVTHLYFLQ